jgi:hypothetical protein
MGEVMANGDLARDRALKREKRARNASLAMAFPDDLIDSHSMIKADSRQDRLSSLEANEIAPKFLYVTPRQSDLWREVFLRHSPIHANPEFARIYRDAFAKIALDPHCAAVRLVGLGCGTGVKERDLCLSVKSAGVQVHFSAIDISRALVAESMQILGAAGATLGRSLVCDLADTDQVSAWLARSDIEIPRLLTLFGLVPNLAPAVITRLVRAVLRPGDMLLVSAHLAPVSESVDLAAAMRRVLPQYDNPETRAWLAAGIEEWGLEKVADAPRIKIGEIEGIPAFVAEARWKSSRPFERWGHSFSPDQAKSLRVFHSLRYTPALFEDLPRKHGFQIEQLAMTACREEAIWLVKLPTRAPHDPTQAT